MTATITEPNAGRIASQKTTRYVPSHLPQTIVRVDRGVVKRTSRLPRTRSSPSEAVAWTLTIIRPNRNCKCSAMISVKDPAARPTL